jgi:hypothetical protein
MRAAFDGVDLFPPREAAFIRAMVPSRIRVLGTVDPPDGASAIESLTYQCETIKIDGLKLYPPGPDARGWVLDDEKNTYPLFLWSNLSQHTKLNQSLTNSGRIQKRLFHVATAPKHFCRLQTVPNHSLQQRLQHGR